MATSKSASETFSRLGMFGDRAKPRMDHIPEPDARKIAAQSDNTFGNCYICSSYNQEELTAAPGAWAGTGSRSRRHPPVGSWRRRPPAQTTRQGSRAPHRTSGSSRRYPARSRCSAVPWLPRPVRSPSCGCCRASLLGAALRR